MLIQIFGDLPSPDDAAVCLSVTTIQAVAQEDIGNELVLRYLEELGAR